MDDDLSASEIASLIEAVRRRLPAGLEDAELIASQTVYDLLLNKNTRVPLKQRVSNSLRSKSRQRARFEDIYKRKTEPVSLPDTSILNDILSIANLTFAEHMLLHYRYSLGLRMKETARRMNISVRYASQLHTEILNKIRRELKQVESSEGSQS